VLIAHPVAEFEGKRAAAVGHDGPDPTGLNDDNLDSLRPDLAPQRIAGCFERELAPRVRRIDGESCDAADGADVDDPAPALTQGGQKRLNDGYVSEQVDLELLAPGVQRQRFERGVDLDTRVVDQCAQWALLRVGGDALCEGIDLIRHRDVEQNGLDARSADPFRVVFGAHPGEHVVAHRGEPPSRRGADSCRGTGDDHDLVLRLPIAEMPACRVTESI
jgi:hypothetical protein